MKSTNTQSDAPPSQAASLMAAWRKRMKDKGWKAFHIWIPAEDVSALKSIMDESGASSRDTLTAVLKAGIAAMRHHTPAELALRPIADMTREDAPTLAEIHRQGCYDLHRGITSQTLATIWNARGYRTRTRRGQWDAKKVERFLNGKAPSTPEGKR